MMDRSRCFDALGIVHYAFRAQGARTWIPVCDTLLRFAVSPRVGTVVTCLRCAARTPPWLTRP